MSPNLLPEHSVYRLTLLGMLFALAAALSFFESMIAGFFALPPGIRPGLSNIVVLFALLVLGRRSAWVLAVLKALFAFLTRGATAGLLSLAGGAASVLVMGLLVASVRVHLSASFLSVLGAIAHNVGQMAMAAFLIRNRYLLFYLPVLLVCGVLSGLLTGVIFKAAQPFLTRMLPKRRRL